MSTQNSAVTATQDFHVWEAGGATSAEALTAWVSARLAAHENALAALLAVEGERTPENSLRHFDEAIAQLSLAGSQAGIEFRGCGQGGARSGADGSATRGDGGQRAESESRGV